ncbi:uncharacterized protein LOC123563678 [Mercenaria mercenaria]|uniref:uncharacterized protein LOC123563678 n=1 Tax=Mercenaria mercenaria TaxID=6596 RepID=UPI00234ED081|nr:uncharacterized protein LOC123563678 [Mercenaria mercenaria]
MFISTPVERKHWKKEYLVIYFLKARMASDTYDVKVYIYDLSRGLARTMSQAFLGKQLEGIWHTGIVVYGKEYFFGGMGGIEWCSPGGTVLGQPTTIHNLGQTQIPYEMFMDYLHDLSQTTFRGECYHLLDHNCNTFSSEVAQFLTGNDIPAVITGLPAEVMSTPFGQMIRPFIDAMSVQPTGGHAVFSDTPSSQSNTKAPPTTSQPSSTAPPPSSQPSQSQNPNSSQTTRKEAQHDKEKSKPFVYATEIGSPSYWCSSELGLSSAVQGHFKEIYEFLSQADDSWSLGRDHMTMLCRLVLGHDKGCEIYALQLLCRLVLKEDIVQLISHDQKSKFPDILDHFENFTEQIKISLIRMLTNCCSLVSGHSLLHDKYRQRTNNICVSGLLSDNEEMTKPAIALSYNLSCRKLSEDSELEIGSALLNCMEKDLDEQTAFHLLTAVLHMMESNEQVKGLAGVLGVSVASYRTKSDRITKLCDNISVLL